jgi:hypothetical protein
MRVHVLQTGGAGGRHRNVGEASGGIDGQVLSLFGSDDALKDACIYFREILWVDGGVEVDCFQGILDEAEDIFEEIGVHFSRRIADGH